MYHFPLVGFSFSCVAVVLLVFSLVSYVFGRPSYWREFIRMFGYLEPSLYPNKAMVK